MRPETAHLRARWRSSGSPKTDLLKFDPLGNVTLLHVADIHGQLMPVYFREPSVNIGVGEASGQPPHITGKDFLKHFGIRGQSARRPTR